MSILKLESLVGTPLTIVSIRTGIAQSTGKQYWLFKLDTSDVFFLYPSEKTEGLYQELATFMEETGMSINGVTIEARETTHPVYGLKTWYNLAPCAMPFHKDAVSYTEALFKQHIFTRETLTGRSLQNVRYTTNVNNDGKKSFFVYGVVEGRNFGIELSANKQTVETIEHMRTGDSLTLRKNTFIPKGDSKEVTYFYLDFLSEMGLEYNEVDEAVRPF